MEIKKAAKKTTKGSAVEIKTGDEKQKALETTIANIEKAFGKGAIMKLGDSANVGNIPVVPSGALSLDIALGVGGIPRGRIIEVFGPESSGKTTIALHAVAETQKAGGICGYVDAEHAMDPTYAKKVGVNIDELYISQPDNGEQALEIAEAMVRSSVIDLVVIDSVAALTPKAEIEGNMGESHMGLQARLMSQALRKLTAFANKTNCTIIFINQLREKIGGMSYGGNETTTGGRALKFYASIRLDIRKVESLKTGDTFIGSRTKVKVAKNKVAPPFKVCHFDIMYGEGISREGDVLDLATDLDLVVKSGAWYSLDSERLGQGRENAKAYLKEHKDVYESLCQKIREHYNLTQVSTIEDETEQQEEKPKKASKKASDSGETEDLIETESVESIDMEIDEELIGDMIFEDEKFNE